MASLQEQDSKKWVNTAVAIAAALLVYVCFAFLQQLGDWFDLESKVNHFEGWAQGVALLVGVAGFFTVTRHPSSHDFLHQVYGELVKVTWPDKDSTVRFTFGILIAVAICSGLLVMVDSIVRWFLSFLY